MASKARKRVNAACRARLAARRALRIAARGEPVLWRGPNQVTEALDMATPGADQTRFARMAAINRVIFAGGAPRRDCGSSAVAVRTK